MGITGYAGSILYVNLTNGRIRKEPLDPELVRSLIGGYGVNNKLAYDLMPQGVDPLSPENLIIIGAGPFAGTLVPGAAKVLVVTRTLAAPGTSVPAKGPSPLRLQEGASPSC